MLLTVHRATLSENCSLLGTDSFRGQISENVFAPNGGYCLYIVLSGKITISDLLDIGLLVSSICLIVFVSGTL